MVTDFFSSIFRLSLLSSLFLGRELEGVMKTMITQPAAESGGGGAERRRCDFCEAAAALVYCRADSARLCIACDRLVHAANTVSARHSRSLICDACVAAPAAILRGGGASSSPSAHHRHHSQPLLLCPNCDFDALHSDGELSSPAERRPIEPYSGCPTAEELISLLGVPPPENKLLFLDDPDRDFLADEDYGWVWETPPILCVEDLLLPPVAAANEFPAMGVPPPPKDRNPSCGRHKEEILRQLRALEFRIEREALPDHDQTEATQQYCWKAERGDFPSTEKPPETVAVEGKALVDGCVPAVVNGVHAPPPPDARSKVPAPDRRLVLSRYKEKRKTRRYDKQIRYESRKARAEGRLRIKGRFAKPGI